MNIIVVGFALSLGLSLILTPGAALLGRFLGGLDWPNSRKVHDRPIPRTGGLAIFIVFTLSMLLGTFWLSSHYFLKLFTLRACCFLFGALVILGMGLLDDFIRLDYKIKFMIQVIGASLAYVGGLRIEFFQLNDLIINFGILSYPITLFWFLLLINAINLIDGLDGLAGGIIFFVCMVMVILLTLQHNFIVALSFAVLAGSVFGFLCYNFNPASVFLGDSGSYFLGYAIAGLSILGSVKSQVSSSLLLPLLALGVPIFDTMFAPLRRFFAGKNMFRPDKGHIHHRLLAMGFSMQKSVWIIYALTVLLCSFSLFLVNVRSQIAFLLLIFLSVGFLIFFQLVKRHYNLSWSQVWPALLNRSSEKGVLDKLTYRRMKNDILHSRDLEELWQNFTSILSVLKFDVAECYLRSKAQGQRQGGDFERVMEGMHKCLINDTAGYRLQWNRWGHIKGGAKAGSVFSRFEVPLIDSANNDLGRLRLAIDVQSHDVNRDMVRCVEDVRKMFIQALEKQDKRKNTLFNKN